MRVDVHSKDDLAVDPQSGKPTMKQERLDYYFKYLDKTVGELKDAGLLDICVIYGFDERPRSEVWVIEDTYKRIEPIISKGSDLAKQLMAFGRPTESETISLDLNYKIRETRKILDRTWSRATMRWN